MSPIKASSRALIAIAGLAGAAGVALAAAASHAGGEALLRPASMICLVHAPAILALAALQDRLRLATVSAWLLVVGTLLFAGDLVSRHFVGSGLFAMAAPTGGMTLIAGWLVGTIGALLPQKSA
ncbi:DUF423 domain-containing protein [Peteryoungia desertarenae]|uniref:DUF423 domain-containing protein n=1 Tax=Peteryoungia desertarenae TaxID=1813451 RepID=A0ABX6QSB7_9HYPH|nr:DUF423 domain-containing protein [Peteryoungia desertarenae]QLF71065.1 DUF423 domain-containing protein [Peteryoungia desertarenae]